MLLRLHPHAVKAAWVYDDGGRQAAGYHGTAGDCVCRAVAIASGRSYAEVYTRLAAGNAAQRNTKRGRTDPHAGQRTAREGICVRRKWFRDYMHELGFVWFPTMRIGHGCEVHLRADELPAGRLVVNVSRHMVAVVNGIIHDTHDPSRDGTRCVYGYYYRPNLAEPA